MDPFSDEQQGSGKGFDPMAMVRAFKRRKWLFIIPFILCLSMAGVAIKIMTPIYYSGGQLKITVNRPSSRLITDSGSKYGGGKQSKIDKQAMVDMSTLLTSPGFLEKVVKELDLHTQMLDANGNLTVRPTAEMSPTDIENSIRKAGNRLGSMIRIENDGTNLFLIGIRDTDPYNAYNLIKTILKLFLPEYRASRLVSGLNTRTFLVDQLSVVESELSAAEAALAEFQTNTTSAALEGSVVNASNLLEVQENLSHLRDRVSGSDANELANLESSVLLILGELPRTRPYARDAVIAGVIRQMMDLGTSQMLLDAGHREYQNIDERLGQLRLRLNSLIEEKVTLNHPQLRYIDRNTIGQYVYYYLFSKGAQDIIDGLSKQIRDFRKFTAAQPLMAAQLTELQDDVLEYRGQVTRLEREITQQSMNLAATNQEIGFQIEIRRKPLLSLVPVEPDKVKLAGMGVILSLGIGLGLVILAIMLDRSFTSVDDIERTLGLTVIGTLPMIQDDHFQHIRKVRLLRWVTIVLGILAVAAIGFLVVYPKLS
jgi:uncharacterized protein involved in exopolysaccharide biosynthesis